MQARDDSCSLVLGTWLGLSRRNASLRGRNCRGISETNWQWQERADVDSDVEVEGSTFQKISIKWLRLCNARASLWSRACGRPKIAYDKTAPTSYHLIRRASVRFLNIKRYHGLRANMCNEAAARERGTIDTRLSLDEQARCR